MRIQGHVLRPAAGWAAWLAVVAPVVAGCGALSDPPPAAERQKEALAALADRDPEDLVATIEEALDGAPVTVTRTNAADRPLLITANEDVARFDYTNEDLSVATQMLAGDDYCINDVGAPELVDYYVVSREIKVEDTPWVCADAEHRDGLLAGKLESYRPSLFSLFGAAAGAEKGDDGVDTWQKPVVEEVDDQWLLHLKGQQQAEPDSDVWLSTDAWIDHRGRPVRLVQEQAWGRDFTWDITYPEDDGGVLAVPEGEERGAYALRTTGDWEWSDGR